MKQTFYMLFMLLALSYLPACSNDKDNEDDTEIINEEENEDKGNYFAEDRRYKYDFFKTVEECEEFQKQFYANCSQTITLYKDGTVAYMMTDIMLPATYDIKGDTITIEVEMPIETPPVIYFLIKDDKEIISMDDGKTWKLY